MKLTNLFTGNIKGKLLTAFLLVLFIFGSFLSIRSCVVKDKIARTIQKNENTVLIDSVTTAARVVVLDSLKKEQKRVDSLQIALSKLTVVNLKYKKQNEKNLKKYDSLNAVLRWVRRPKF